MNGPEPSQGTRTLPHSQAEDTEEWHMLGEWDHSGKVVQCQLEGLKAMLFSEQICGVGRN